MIIDTTQNKASQLQERILELEQELKESIQEEDALWDKGDCSVLLGHVITCFYGEIFGLYNKMELLAAGDSDDS